MVEWRSFLRQLTASKAQKAEPATVKSVVQTVTELYQFQLLRGRAAGLADVALIDLSSFLTEGTSAPSRALPALRWFSKHAALDWALGILLREHQAVAALPFMAAELESRIFQAHSRSDLIWMPLLGAWLVTCGCIRYAHLDRSSVRYMTESTVIVGVARASRQPRAMVLIGQFLLSSLAVGTSVRFPPTRRSDVDWCLTTWVTVGPVPIHRRHASNPSMER